MTAHLRNQKILLTKSVVSFSQVSNSMVVKVRDGRGCRLLLFVLFMDFAVSTKMSEAFFFSILA